MAMNDTLAAAMNDILNAEKIGRSTCVVTPVSKVTKVVLEIMKENKYIGEFKIIEDGKGGLIEINLIGGINKCGVIKPRFSVEKQEFVKFEKRYLPARGFGLMIISTSSGVMTQEQAKEKGIGGKLLAYVY
jgi:small subunit ribosomal protein S8